MRGLGRYVHILCVWRLLGREVPIFFMGPSLSVVCLSYAASKSEEDIGGFHRHDGDVQVSQQDCLSCLLSLSAPSSLSLSLPFPLPSLLSPSPSLPLSPSSPPSLPPSSPFFTPSSPLLPPLPPLSSPSLPPSPSIAASDEDDTNRLFELQKSRILQQHSGLSPSPRQQRPRKPAQAQMHSDLEASTSFGGMAKDQVPRPPSDDEGENASNALYTIFQLTVEVRNRPHPQRPSTALTKWG